MDEIDRFAEILFKYGQLHQTIQKADAIFVLGSRDLRSAHLACDLYLKGYAPLLIFTGDSGTQKVLAKTEAETFRDIALERGIPDSAIIIENKSKSSGHNIEFAKNIIAEKGLSITSLIVIQKPHTERRIYAAIQKQWPEVTFTMASYPVSCKDYLYNNPDYTREEVINRMVGDFQRIVEYPKQGFQTEQEVPPEVMSAFKSLVKAGFDKKLVAPVS